MTGELYVVEYRDVEGWTFDEVRADTREDAAWFVQRGRSSVRQVKTYTQEEWATRLVRKS